MEIALLTAAAGLMGATCRSPMAAQGGFMAAVAAIHDGHWRCLAEVPMASCTYCMLQLPQQRQCLLNHLDDLGKVSGSRYLAAATAPDNSRATCCRARYAAASIDLGR